jgi:hypothetical protein
MLLQRWFHGTTALQARFPALQTRISRNEFKRNQKKIAELKEKLGEKYRIIGRDKRRSPLTERRSPSIDSQPPKPKERIPLIKPFLFDPINGCLDIGEKVETTEVTDTSKRQDSIRDFVVTSRVEKEIQTVLTLNKNALPPIVIKEKVELKTQKGPFYQHGILPSETEFILKKTPLVTQKIFQEQVTQQPELMRRILSLSTANNQEIRKFNTQRVIEMFQRSPGDTGSSEVQGLQH